MSSPLRRRAFVLTLAAVAVAPALAEPAREARAVADFDAVVVRGSIHVTLRQAAREALELRADADVLPLIETSVSGGTLTIAPKKGASWRGRERIEAVVDVVRLKSVSASGSGDVRVDGVKTPALALALAGSGDAKVSALETDKLALQISGSGDADLAGRAAALSVRIAGSGDVRARALASDDVAIRIAGSGGADVTAHRSLDVSIAGSGDVTYGGQPTLKTSVAGSGRIRSQ